MSSNTGFYLLESASGSDFIFVVTLDGEYVYCTNTSFVMADDMFRLIYDFLSDQFGLNELLDRSGYNFLGSLPEESYSSSTPGYHLIADEDGIYFDRMGDAGRKAFLESVGSGF